MKHHAAPFKTRKPATSPKARPLASAVDASRNDFLSRIQRTPVVRYLPMRRPPLPRFMGPLKILVVQSSSPCGEGFE
jgi:hypothetical protein